MDVSCDTIKHPIVKKTQAALEKGDVKPIMKWVNKEKEKEISKKQSTSHTKFRTDS